MMPQKSKLKLPDLNLGDETTGQRIARLRKEKGLTQVELAEKIGIIQKLISKYERDKLRLHGEMVARFALALEVSADEILGLKNPEVKRPVQSLKIARRMEKIASLPISRQRALLETIYNFITGVETRERVKQ